MYSVASVSYSVLLDEILKRKTEKRINEINYCESLIFDLHMAQKSLQRAVYAQQINIREKVSTSFCHRYEALSGSSK
jgi:hypothetical protein